MNFGTRLKILRVINKLDQEKMSKRLHVSQPVYSRYENDEKEVNENDAFVKRVADEFAVIPGWLTSTDDHNLFFEIENSKPGERGSDQRESRYSVPKEFVEMFLKQQEITGQLLKILVDIENKNR